MEKNHILGFIFLFATLFVWSYINKPDAAELEKRKRMQDSIAALEIPKDTLSKETIAIANQQVTSGVEVSDSVRLLQNSSTFGPFTSASLGSEQEFTLENEKIKITFSNKGGKIVSAELKEYTTRSYEKGEITNEEPVVLLNDERNKFNYLLPVATVPSGAVNSEDLYFQAQKNGNSITFTVPTSNGGSFTQKYSLDDTYGLDYDLEFNNLESVLDARNKKITLDWQNYLGSYERNSQFEQQYSAVYYKENEESNPDDCGCMQDDEVLLENEKIDWVSHSNQYFNSSLITMGSPFSSGKVASQKSELPDDHDAEVDYLEKLTSQLDIDISGKTKMDMEFYIGPNDFNNLKGYDNGLEYTISFGTSIFGTINRYVIRPVFNFFSRYIGSLGIVIILVIFIIKMLLYPLMYKMLHSQALMGALKPQLAPLNEKYKDDAQQKQVETMKLYKEYGVSPFGGCMPMLVQMPIWYALFRFFPASIDFRQESFLWAHDLSSYDDIIQLPFNIPFVGEHLSLFTILYSISMLAYTYYNTKHMDMSANPAMKYVQYFMPVMFFGFFNTYASGLTCYMFFSNLINITQTVVTKKFVFTDEKLQQELKVKKSKPKKQSNFQKRLEEAMKAQQQAQNKKKK